MERASARSTPRRATRRIASTQGIAHRSSGYRLKPRLSCMRSRLRLLGPVSLAGPDGGFARRASQQRRLALLALIATGAGGSTSRDRLLGLLWPDRDDRTARHLLADSLYVLRQTLGDEAIVATGDSLRLSGDLMWTDVGEFRQAVDDGRWSDALAVYRGDFLDGFYVR